MHTHTLSLSHTHAHMISLSFAASVIEEFSTCQWIRCQRSNLAIKSFYNFIPKTSISVIGKNFQAVKKIRQVANFYFFGTRKKKISRSRFCFDLKRWQIWNSWSEKMQHFIDILSAKLAAQQIGMLRKFNWWAIDNKMLRFRVIYLSHVAFKV